MGRKPNALILEFFERGAKLEDASNRYQHTCRKCGEKFPKGRIDSLTNHLVKKCPMISLRDRQKALLQLNDLPDQIADSARIQNPSQNADAQMSGHPVELPIVNRNWTALQTLAEVSRLTDINEKQNDRVQHNSSAGARSRTSEPPRSGFELQEQYTLDNPPTSYEQRGNREKKASNPKTTPRRDSEATLPPANFRRMSHSRSRSPTLEEAATSIAAAARAVGAAFVPNMVEQHNLDPQLLAEDNMNVPMDNSPDMSESTAIAQLTQANATMPNQFYSPTPGEQQPWQISQPMMESHGGNMFPEQDHIPQELQNALQHGGMMRTDGVPQLSMNQFNQGMTTEFSAEWGNGQKTNRPKVRGRFTPNRRDEVQKVRKKGACIRCRMLKKPCSEGDPCDTCKNVESARLWKQPCLRTRLADELNMYSAALYGVLSHNEINAAKHRVKFVSSPNQIDISHYPDTTVYATFKALEGLEAPAEGNIDPTLGLNFHGAPTLRILDNENDDLPMKLEAYMKRISPVFFEKEPSRFMNVTLKTASELSVQKDDQLLKKALEFWSIVHILVDTELRWTITQRGNVDDEAGQGQVIELRQDEKDNAFSVMCTQLNAAAEKKAAAICKTVFGDLERRLLHKTANNSFELFLVALILLNCVEKSTWLFKMWEHSNFPSRWPLDKTPNWFASRGDKVIDLLQMLLRIRNIPPKTYTTEDGILASDGSGTKLYTKEEDGVVATDGSQDARQFFENIQLSYEDVLNKQNHHVFVPSDSRCYELRFCSRLLLPTKLNFRPLLFCVQGMFFYLGVAS